MCRMGIFFDWPALLAKSDCGNAPTPPSAPRKTNQSLRKNHTWRWQAFGTRLQMRHHYVIWHPFEKKRPKGANGTKERGLFGFNL